MAHIYAGNRPKVVPALLEAVRTLPDCFWVFLEFNIGRNVDCLAIRLSPGQPTGFRNVEVKWQPYKLRGNLENGPWEELVEGEWGPARLPSNENDINYGSIGVSGSCSRLV